MPDWHILYQAAVEETNPRVFESLVYETEDAIWSRLRELAISANGVPELDEISGAAQQILELKIKRLGCPQSNCSAATSTPTRYAHTFLFVCPACNLPISVSRIRSKRNLDTKPESFDLKCAYCTESFVVLAFTAKAHWVIEWA